MSPRKEYFLILLISIGIPLLSYSIAYPYFKNEEPTALITEQISQKFTKDASQNEEPISLLFVGDIMLDRTIRKDGELYGYTNLFSCLQDEFAKYDEVIGNLEGTVTEFESVSRNASYESPESFRFTFDKEAVMALKNIGLSIVSLGNNHIRDFGDEGIAQTIKNTNDIKLLTFGNPQKGIVRYVIKDIKGTKIAFIPYNQFFGTKEQTYQDLESTKALSDIQIVFTHWGDEYVPARNDIKLLARTFVDQGADLIIGTHPHVIQEGEIYKNISIYYSLGNFIFDQYWEEAVRTGLGVIVDIDNKKINKLSEQKFESTRHEGTCKK
jgi:poly-gamma-glutamate synthesis protein (capsule biosynthesis protein)